jgi:hypothetical protein
MIKNKKGQTYEVLEYYVIRIPFVILLIVLFLYISGSLEGRALSSHNTREQIILNRIFYSPNSISYYNATTDRVYPGIIDLSKFQKEAVLDKAFYTGDNRVISGKLELIDLETNETYETYINKDDYNKWKNYIKFDQYENFIDKRYVLIKDGDMLKRGIIKINFVIPNE